MRFRQLFIALVCIVSTQGFSTLHAASPPSVKAQVDLEMQALLQGMGTTTALEDRMKMLSRFELVVKGLREHSPRQAEEDELYLDTYLGMLAEIPREKHFKKASCGEYTSRLKFDYEPTAEGAPEDPAVEAGLKTLAALCA
jgi:hypothetical protein